MTKRAEPDEAPYPSPTLTVYMRCTENDAPQDYEGGRVVFKPVKAGLNPAILDMAVAVSASTDEFLVQWPWRTRAAKQGRYYRLTLEEVTAADLPPATDAVPSAASKTG